MKNKKVIILHNNVLDKSFKDELDNLIESEEVSQALIGLGYEPIKLAFINNIDFLINKTQKIKPKFVFNLVETVNGDGRLAHFAPALLEHLDIPFSGCSSTAIFLTSNKILCKQILKNHGIPTPLWFTLTNFKTEKFQKGNYIVKPIWEDASIGIDSESIKYCNTKNELLIFLETREKKIKKECMAEFYIDGREFNISVISDKNKKIKILPIAEIVFTNYNDKFKIIDYNAKWNEDSFEYKNTNRTFEFPKNDKILLKKLKDIVLKCAQIFELQGYSRIDLRVDKNNKPYILEINANPCISKNAGFAAAAQYAGYDYKKLIFSLIPK
ncbi:MAG TPA: ATP-grasp domain-containing protein [bacterium]|nr:ATP-grasp domain-containing protein [bacterium]HPP87559.1 ATP-grasp domain-containing protein [bacterium]